MIWILAPNKYKIETENQETGEKDTTFALRGFRPAGVFAVEDTDDPDLPKPALLIGEAPAAIWDGVTELLQEAGCTVSREPIEGRANGDTDPEAKRVRVDSHFHPYRPSRPSFTSGTTYPWAMSTASRSTGFTADCRKLRQSQPLTSRWRPRLDTSAYSFDYITGWASGDPKLLMATAERVLTTAHETVERLTSSNGLDSPGVAIGVAL